MKGQANLPDPCFTTLTVPAREPVPCPTFSVHEIFRRRQIVLRAETGGNGDITLLCWHAEGYRSLGIECLFYTDHPGQRELLTLFGQKFAGSRKWSIDTGGNFYGYGYEVNIDKGATPRAQTWAKCLPLQPPLIRPTAHIDPKAVSWAKKSRDEFVSKGQAMLPDPFVLLFPWAEWQTRMWPLAHWIDLAAMLEAKGIDTAVMAPASRQAECKAFRRAYWGHSWNQVAAMMNEADLIIANDSGPSHIAATLGRPTLALMGSTSNIFTHASNAREIAIGKEDLACVGCHFDSARGFRGACNHGCQAMMRLYPDRVAAIAEGMARGVR